MGRHDAVGAAQPLLPPGESGCRGRIHDAFRPKSQPCLPCSASRPDVSRLLPVALRLAALACSSQLQWIEWPMTAKRGLRQKKQRTRWCPCTRAGKRQNSEDPACARQSSLAYILNAKSKTARSIRLSGKGNVRRPIVSQAATGICKRRSVAEAYPGPCRAQCRGPGCQGPRPATQRP